MDTQGTQYDRIDWLALLRARFTEVASRRVMSEDVEKVVTQAMRAVIDSDIAPGVDSIQGSPPVAWCFQVLRNTIGRYYREADARARRLSQGERATPTALARPIECVDSHEVLNLVQTALEAMGGSDAHCALFFNRFVEGAHPHEIIAEDDLDPVAFHRYLFGCRRKLRDLIRSQSVDI